MMLSEEKGGEAGFNFDRQFQNRERIGHKFAVKTERNPDSFCHLFSYVKKI